ncbi:MAG TPA: MBL fold metallo-hydrolase [Cellvibrio sp.]|nr:MBL fold metallo-hydrolase [Cellvibrio sp.]
MLLRATASLFIATLLAGCGTFFTEKKGIDSVDMFYEGDASAKAGLRATFFGTSTILITDGVNSIMIDGFFSRPSLFRLIRVRPDLKRIDFALSKAPRKIDAIFVAHSHYDHAMDSGLVAQKTGAAIYGSESTLNIARGQNTHPSQLHLLKKTQPVGAFRVTAIETPHSPQAKYVGDIHQPVKPPAKLSDYRMGENFSFFLEHPLGNVLIIPSATDELGSTFNKYQANVVFLGIGTLGKQSCEFTETYWKEAVVSTGAKLVLPIHWDNFMKSLSKPLVPFPFFIDNPGVAVDRLRVMAERDRVQLNLPPSLHEFSLPALRD